MSSVPSSSPSVLSPSSADVPSPSRHSRCIVVSHLAPVLTLAHLEDLFNTIGPIQTLQWHSTPPPLSERVCLVEFVHEKHAQLAPLITDTVIGDKAIQIQPLTTFNKPSPPPSTTTPAPSTASAPPPTSASPPSTSSPLPSPHSTAPPVTGAPLVPYNFLHPPPALPLATPFPPSLPFPLDPTFTSSTIYVGNLSPVVTDAVLAEYFTQLGPLVGVQLQADTIGPNRFAFVEFQDPRAAHMALALHGQFLLGRPMKVGKANVGVGKGLLTEGERQQRAVGLGAAAGAADKVAEALAKVAAAQLSIANKLGVKVQTPAISTMAPTLTAGLPPTAAPPVMVEGGDKEKEGTGEERKERGRGRSSRSRSRSGSRSRGRSSRSRRSYSSSSRSRSPSHSPSRSVSRSRSGSRSPRSRRHRSRRDHRRHHRDRSRERSHRSSRHRRSSSRSLSPHAEGPRNAEKKEGGEGPVGADRWRAEDSEDAAMETKEAGAREKERSRDRERSKGRSSHRRHGEYSEGHRHSSSHSRRRKSEWSDDGEDADRHVYTGVGRGGGFRGRRKNGADPHAGMVWDGFSWRAKELPSADPNIGRIS